MENKLVKAADHFCLCIYSKIMAKGFFTNIQG